MSVARFIADQRTFYRVPHAVCCVILGVSISWFYKWLDREPCDRQRVDAAADIDNAGVSHGDVRKHIATLAGQWHPAAIDQ